MALDPSDFVDVIDLTPEQFAAEGAARGDSLLAEANDFPARVANAEMHGSSVPPVARTSTDAQGFRNLNAAQAALAEAATFTLPDATPEHADYLTSRPERPGNAEDRPRTRLRLAALNQPR